MEGVRLEGLDDCRLAQYLSAGLLKAARDLSEAMVRTPPSVSSHIHVARAASLVLGLQSMAGELARRLCGGGPDTL